MGSRLMRMRSLSQLMNLSFGLRLDFIAFLSRKMSDSSSPPFSRDQLSYLSKLLAALPPLGDSAAAQSNRHRLRSPSRTRTRGRSLSPTLHEHPYLVS